MEGGDAQRRRSVTARVPRRTLEKARPIQPRRVTAYSRTAAIAALLLLIAAVDLSRAPGRQVMGRAAIAAIHVYRATLSPVLPRIGISCRFVPSCSHYAEVSIAKYGVGRGSWRSIKRIARCNPWTPMGTVDEP